MYLTKLFDELTEELFKHILIYYGIIVGIFNAKNVNVLFLFMKASNHQVYYQRLNFFTLKVISVLCMLRFYGLPSKWEGLYELLKRLFQSTGLVTRYKNKILLFFFECSNFIPSIFIQWDRNDRRFFNHYMKRLLKEGLHQDPVFLPLENAYTLFYRYFYGRSSPDALGGAHVITQTEAPIIPTIPIIPSTFNPPPIDFSSFSSEDESSLIEEDSKTSANTSSDVKSPLTGYSSENGSYQPKYFVLFNEDNNCYSQSESFFSFLE